MKRLICTLPNASGEISGVRFTEDRGQMISEEVEDDVAEGFAKIPGYVIAGTPPKDAAATAPLDLGEDNPPPPRTRARRGQGNRT